MTTIPLAPAPPQAPPFTEANDGQLFNGYRRRIFILTAENVVPLYKQRDFYQGFSASGMCLRKTWGEKYAVPQLPRTLATVAAFRDGHIHEESVVGLYRELGFEIMTGLSDGEQFELVATDPVFTDGFKGHIDGLINLDGKWFILEVKSANVNQWRLVSTQGVRKRHFTAFCQIQMYLHHARQLTVPIEGCLYVCKAKESTKTEGQYYEEIISYDPQAAARIYEYERKKARWLSSPLHIPPAAQLSKDLETRYIDREDTPLCSPAFCQVSDWCHTFDVRAVTLEEPMGLRA